MLYYNHRRGKKETKKEVNTMTKYTVTINGNVYNTNNRDTVMCLLMENPNAEVKVN